MNAMLKPEDIPRGTTPASTHGLSEKQAEFVKQFTAGVPQGKAAAMAGYSSPATDAWRLLQTPSVIAAITREAQNRLLTEGQAMALAFMIKAPANEKLPGAVRFQAAKWVMETAGHGLAAQRAALGLPADDTPLAEMSVTQLDQLLAAGREAIAQLKDQSARTIDGSARNVTSEGVADGAQVIDSIEHHDK